MAYNTPRHRFFNMKPNMLKFKTFTICNHDEPLIFGSSSMHKK